jgi:hypothetical protein
MMQAWIITGEWEYEEGYWIMGGAETEDEAVRLLHEYAVHEGIVIERRGEYLYWQVVSEKKDTKNGSDYYRIFTVKLGAWWKKEGEE